MAKIVYIGAGSIGFGQLLISDTLTNPALKNSHLTLMDINEEKLDINYRYARKVAAQVGSTVSVEAVTDLAAALEGADYVYETTLKHGVQTRNNEQKTCRKHGFNPYAGCTTGPSGVFRALREIPATLEILRVMEKVCPNAYYLHYANPTNTVSLGLSISSPIKSVGLCHSVEGTAKEMSQKMGIPFSEIAYWAAGVNHQAWILRFESHGKDLYPEFRKLNDDKEIYEEDKVRFEMMNFFGYFPTESSKHNSEYVPYFRRTSEMTEFWAPGSSNHIELEAISREERRSKLAESLDDESPVVFGDHNEFCIRVIAAMESNKTFCFNGNILNNGLITNLPPDICVEVPIMVDGTGLHPCYVGKLPDQCAALNANRCAGDLLAVKGALEGDKKAVEQAIALDPLTASILTLDEIKALVAELFEVDREFLPQFR